MSNLLIFIKLEKKISTQRLKNALKKTNLDDGSNNFFFNFLFG